MGALERIPAPALLIGAIISLQVGSAFAITLFPHFGPAGTMFLRMAFGALLLVGIYRAALLGAARKQPMGVVILGLTMTVQSACFYEALDRIPLGLAVAIEFLGPLGLALVTSRRPMDAAFVVIATVGVLLLTPLGGGDLDPVGMAWAGGAGLGWACFIVASKRLGKALDGGVGLALAMSVSALVLMPFVGPQTLAILSDDLALLVPVLAMALFSGAVPFLFEFLALKRMTMTTFGVLIAIEPVIAALVGVIALGDILTTRAWIAVAIITAAALGAAVLENRGRQGTPPIS